MDKRGVCDKGEGNSEDLIDMEEAPSATEPNKNKNSF